MEHLKDLDERLRRLESMVGANSTEEAEVPKTAVDQLYDLKQELTNVTSGRERVHNLWKRLDELNEYLDPEKAAKLTLSEDMKANIILAEKSHIEEQAALLEQVDQMKGVLGSEHIQAAPDMVDKLHPLAIVQVDQQEQLEALGTDVRQLLEAYNDIISLVSKQFVQWDETLTKYEVSKKVRKTNEYI